jgi:queuine tRNA-ribosyltransferase
LILSGEVLGGILVSAHNLCFYQELMRQMRDALASETFTTWQREFVQSPACRLNREEEP